MLISKRDFLKGVATVTIGASVSGIAQAAEKLPEKWDRETDVIILGYGGAGASAAITAKDAGADVVIFEKCPEGGGNTAISSGGMMIMNDRDRALAYLKKTYELSNSDRDDEVLEAYVDEAMKNREFLLSLAPDQKLYIYGHATYQEIPESDSIDKWRFRTPKGKNIRGGDMLFNSYRNAVENIRKIPIVYNARGLELIKKDGEVVGAWIEIDGKKQAVKARKGVVLATGGFAYNDKMLSNYTMGQKFHRVGHPGNTGDGVLMAQAAGADLWHMNAMSCPLGFVVPGLKTSLQINMLAPSYIYVDQDGKRFVNEKIDNHNSIYGVNYFDAVKNRYPRIPCYVIFDEEARQAGPIIGGATSGYALNREHYKWSKDNSAEIEKGVIVTAPTLEELAAKINVPPENLVESVKRWNEQIKAGADKDFGRPIERKGKAIFEGREAPILSKPIGKGPYYAAALYPTILNTQGGPKKNKFAQVVDPFGKPIPRLYVAGELGSICGHTFQATVNNSEASVFGRIAGRNVAKEKNWE